MAHAEEPSQGPAAEVDTRPAPGGTVKPGSGGGGKSVGTRVETNEPLGEAVGVRPIDPAANQPGAPAGRMGPGQESSAGAGLKFRFGGKKKPRRSMDTRLHDRTDPR